VLSPLANDASQYGKEKQLVLSPLANDASQFGKEKQRQYIYLTPKAPKRVLVAPIIVSGNVLGLVKNS
jgi:hypothetical protein